MGEGLSGRAFGGSGWDGGKEAVLAPLHLRKPHVFLSLLNLNLKKGYLRRSFLQGINIPGVYLRHIYAKVELHYNFT